MRRATLEPLSDKSKRGKISIHALREESDTTLNEMTQADVIISIHALREESDGIGERGKIFGVISIHALREESDYGIETQYLRFDSISIHALREESDRNMMMIMLLIIYFNPRSP